MHYSTQSEKDLELGYTQMDNCQTLVKNNADSHETFVNWLHYLHTDEHLFI